MSRFALRLAWREARAGARRIGVYVSAIAAGVAALVAIDSFRADAIASIDAQARRLLGADARLESDAPFPAPVEALLDSLRAGGADLGRTTRLATMALAVRGGGTRLVQLQAVEGEHPFYGDVATEPAGLWPLEAGADRALADPAALVQLDAAPGDTLAIGTARFVVAGTVTGMPGDVGIRAALGPAIYIHASTLPATGLIQTGSLVEYQALMRLGGGRAAAAALEASADSLLSAHGVDLDTVEEQVERLTSTTAELGRYLGLVALMALLLGGVGVASAVHVFVRERLPGIAVLRCLGATQRTVFAAYLLQTALLGAAGAAAGALLGLLAQRALPLLLGPFLPVAIESSFHPGPVLAGIAAGVWTAVIFAALPLLAVRDVAPLQALRRDVDPPPARFDALRALAWAALAASLLGLALLRAPDVPAGLGFAAGIAAALLLLWGAALGLAAAARRLLPRRAPFTLRQGVSNLFRPRNQTVAVTVAVGFGVFLVATIWLVQVNLLDRLAVDAEEGRPDLLLFDVQPDQLEPVRTLMRETGVEPGDAAAIVPARIAAIDGRDQAALLADTAIAEWALRHEYRNTWRDTLAATEELVAGEWWDGSGRADLPRVSVDAELADDLGVAVGDVITWDVQGVRLDTRVASLRLIDWTRFAPNFFVVFEPGVLEQAPHSWVALATSPDAHTRARVQTELVRAFPNVSILDLAHVQEAVGTLLDRATLAVRFLALFSLAGGLLVLTGALAASRVQRLREAALLATLGATRGRVARILLTEYLLLGGLGGLAGAALALVASWLLVTRVFELAFRPAAPALALVALATAAVAAAIGSAMGRALRRRPPLELLREAAE